MTDRRRTRSSGPVEHSEGVSPSKRKSSGRGKAAATRYATGEEEKSTNSSSQATSHAMEAINIAQWLEENQKAFLPPVCNKLMHSAGQLKIMYVGGPNERRDYHIEEGEELFYMVKGDMCLKIIEKGLAKDVPIKEGEMFLLPSRIPHSPQRAENTIGLVIERERLPTETDGLRFFCDDGVTTLYQEWFYCTDLGTQLVPVIERFKASDAFKSRKPSQDYTQDDAPVKVDIKTAVVPPFSLQQWLARHASDIKSSGSAQLLGKGEFQISVFGPGNDQITSNGHETFLWQLEGDSTVSSGSGSCVLHKDDSLLLPDSSDVTYTVKREEGCLQMVVWMDQQANK